MGFKEFLRVNWVKTIFFNFSMLPLKTACKFPFLLYGNIKLTSLDGQIDFNVPVKKFMCKLGRNVEIITLRSKSELRIDGKLEVNGSFSFGNDFIVHIMKGAILKIGEASYFGRKTQIICTSSISIGDSMRFGYESQIIDSNFHYVVDLSTGIINTITKPIEIGHNTWIGNRTTIMAGTQTNNYLIVGSNSLLNKDYKQTVPEYSLIAGMPATLIRCNIVRVFNFKTEGHINQFFRQNKGKHKVNLFNDLHVDQSEIF